MLDKLISNISRLNRTTLILITVVVLAVVGVGIFLSQRISSSKEEDVVEEVEVLFDAEGPYAILYPRRDGNAMNLNLKRTTSYDSINYELSYVSEADAGAEGGGGSIDRGVIGNIDTKDKKGEYDQEILFGTCSKNVCKYDKGVENGTLILHIKKDNQLLKMITQWRLQKPDVSLGKLASGDEHFKYQTKASKEELTLVGFTIVNDLTGVPKLPPGKQVLGKAYALNVPQAKTLPKGEASIEISETPPAEAKLARYNDSKNDWEILDTKIDGSKLTGQAEGAGIFAILVDSSKN